MRTIDEWLDAYGESHQNPLNKTIHRIAVPIIAIDMVGLAQALPTTWISPTFPNAAPLLVIAALAFYARLSLPLTAGMAGLALGSLALLDGLQTMTGAWFVPLLVAVFVVAWAAQFVGHKAEGKKPSFLVDLQFLLIGPLWLLADAYRRAGIRYASRRPVAT